MQQKKSEQTQVNIQIICFTDAGQRLAERLAEEFHAGVHRSSREVPVRVWTRQHFQEASALVYIGAAGIAVRSIAPYIQSKVKDPAVLVMDEKGKHVIPILSGHLGGANDLAREIAAFCGAEPVLTTATDVNDAFAVDEWAKKNRCLVYNPKKIVCVSSKVLNKETVVMQSAFPVRGKIPAGIRFYVTGKETDGRQADIILDIHLPLPKQREKHTENPSCEKNSRNRDALYLVPGILVLGVGCRKGIPAQKLENAFGKFLAENHLYEQAFVSAASIDLKKEEPGLLEFCRNHAFRFRTFSAEELEKAPGTYTASDFVKRVTGTDNVCERSAVLASGGSLLVRKTAEGGVTLAAAQMPFQPCWQGDLISGS